MEFKKEIMIPSEDVNRNWACIKEIVAEHGSAVITEHGIPRYLVTDVCSSYGDGVPSVKDVMAVAEQVLHENLPAYKELAK